MNAKVVRLTEGTGLVKMNTQTRTRKIIAPCELSSSAWFSHTGWVNIARRNVAVMKPRGWDLWVYFEGVR